jgi:hypothetical protein
VFHCNKISKIVKALLEQYLGVSSVFHVRNMEQTCVDTSDALAILSCVVEFPTNRNQLLHDAFWQEEASDLPSDDKGHGGTDGRDSHFKGRQRAKGTPAV